MEFLEGLNQMVQDSIDEEIKQQLFDDWIFEQGEDMEYLEFAILSSASPEIQKQYNAYYDRKPEDDYYFDGVN